MELAVIISLIAMAVALPGCIADSMTVIVKLRELKKSKGEVRPLFKKTEVPHAYQSFVFPELRLATLFKKNLIGEHRANGIRLDGLGCVDITT
ncbi:MAG TPA: hypothetical protein VK421_02965 [Pyrinomonadaceae bacterium]|nr:hypothetical protein [Pyrinomonadaceae bacterium]